MTDAATIAKPCPHCDNTGDVHRADGEWLGECPDCRPTTIGPTVAEIAATLTKAQREALIYARGPDADGLTWFALGSARGLPVELKRRTVVGHCLTPLGLAVRAILAQETDR